MTFEVVDDGVGFDPAAAGPEGHLGMRLISEMVADAGGCSSWSRWPGRAPGSTASCPSDTAPRHALVRDAGGTSRRHNVAKPHLEAVGVSPWLQWWDSPSAARLP